MTEFIINILEKIQNYSTSISKKATFLDKPWALVDNEMEIQKLIFQKDNQLVLSKNGKVQMGTWEYLAGAKSMLIDRGGDKILLNEVFINDDVMILKIDGTKHEFFVLANQNTIPDLDVIGYLEGLRFKYFLKKDFKLENNKILKLYHPNNIAYPYKDGVALINDEIAKSGFYNYLPGFVFLIENGKVIRLYNQKYHTNTDNLKIRLLQLNEYNTETAEFVYLNEERIMDGEVNFTKNKVLIVKNGKVVQLKRKKSIMQSITNLFKKK